MIVDYIRSYLSHVLHLLLFLSGEFQSFYGGGSLFLCHLAGLPGRRNLYPGQREADTDTTVIVLSYQLQTLRIILQVFPESSNKFLLCERSGYGFLSRVPLDIVFLKVSHCYSSFINFFFLKSKILYGMSRLVTCPIQCLVPLLSESQKKSAALC